jgi:hypothetical protein
MADSKAPRESYVVLTKCFNSVGEAKVNQHGLSRKVSYLTATNIRADKSAYFRRRSSFTQKVATRLCGCLTMSPVCYVFPERHMSPRVEKAVRGLGGWARVRGFRRWLKFGELEAATNRRQDRKDGLDLDGSYYHRPWKGVRESSG